MKSITILILLITNIIMAQNVTYTASTDIIPNPERGFYKHESTDSSSYSPLVTNELISDRVNNKITLVLRLFYLESFLTTNISSTYLTNITTDFSRARAAGVKLIVRFAYSDGNNPGSNNPTKSQILSHINQLSPIIIANKDVISCVQAGFIGAWGEWYYTDYFGQGSPTTQQIADRNEILQAILDNFPTYVQVRTPLFKQKFIGNTTPLDSTQAFSNSDKSRIGHHNDSFLSSNSEQGTYSGSSSNILLERQYVKDDTKYVPMGGEANEFPTAYTTCSSATQAMNDYNYTYFNSVGYASGIISNWTTNGCLDEMKRNLGYRFTLISSSIDNNLLIITLGNTGWANVFKDRKAYIVFKNTSTNTEYSFVIDENIKNWNSTNKVISLSLIQNVPAGTYNLFLNLPDPLLPNNPLYSIQLANTGVWNSTTGYNNLSQQVVLSTLTTTTTTTSSGTTSTTSSTSTTTTTRSLNYIVVVKGMITSGLPNFTVKIYNMAGRKVSTSKDVSTLRRGVYIVEVFVNRQKQFTQKINI